VILVHREAVDIPVSIGETDAIHRLDGGDDRLADAELRGRFKDVIADVPPSG
jgi:hypothetical protein